MRGGSRICPTFLPRTCSFYWNFLVISIIVSEAFVR